MLCDDPPRLAQPIRMSCVRVLRRNHNSIVSKIVLIRERCDLKKKKTRRLLRNTNNAGFAVIQVDIDRGTQKLMQKKLL